LLELDQICCSKGIKMQNALRHPLELAASEMSFSFKIAKLLNWLSVKQQRGNYYTSTG
jgi:hypothetical protein